MSVPFGHPADAGAGVYAITNTANGRVYIGQTQDFHVRWRDWQRWLQQPVYPRKFSDDVLAYGPDVFVFEALERVDDPADRDWAECDWVDRLGTLDPRTGYNRCSPPGWATYQAHSDLRSQIEQLRAPLEQLTDLFVARGLLRESKQDAEAES